MLQCVLYKLSINIEPLSLTLHGVNTRFIHQPPKKKWQLRQFFQRKFWRNVLLDSLMCPLQIINDIEPLTLTLHDVNACFIHHPSKSKITQSAISLTLVNQKKEKKSSAELHIFTPLCKFLGQNSKYWVLQKFRTFLNLANWHLMAQQMAQGWHIQKSKIG